MSRQLVESARMVRMLNITTKERMRKSNARVEMLGWPLLFVSAYLLSGCAGIPVPRPLPVQSQQWKKAALVQDMILPPSLPSFPLIQAGIYRTAFSKIEPNVTKLHQDRIDGYEELLGQHLSTSFPFTVFYGKELLKVDAFKNIDHTTIKTFEAMPGGGSVSSMVIPSRGYNFFYFTKNGPNPKSVFREKDNAFINAHAGSIAALCKNLDVDSVVVASLYIETTEVNFLAQGSKRLILTVAFFDRDGKICHFATDWTRGNTSTGGDLDSYTKTMDMYPALVERLVQRLAEINKTSGK